MCPVTFPQSTLRVSVKLILRISRSAAYPLCSNFSRTRLYVNIVVHDLTSGRGTNWPGLRAGAILLPQDRQSFTCVCPTIRTSKVLVVIIKKRQYSFFEVLERAKAASSQQLSLQCSKPHLNPIEPATMPRRKDTRYSMIWICNKCSSCFS